MVCCAGASITDWVAFEALPKSIKESLRTLLETFTIKGNLIITFEASRTIRTLLETAFNLYLLSYALSHLIYSWLLSIDFRTLDITTKSIPNKAAPTIITLLMTTAQLAAREALEAFGWIFAKFDRSSV